MHGTKGMDGRVLLHVYASKVRAVLTQSGIRLYSRDCSLLSGTV